MSLIAVGLDLVEVERVRRLLQSKGERALRRLLTDAERDYCMAQAVPERHVAARLAAKEAAYKALAHG
ncbi:MAG: 4'-phosphopantetheinyl transferase superfamily protein, partial [Gemmatimonadales bacterium]